MGVRTVVEPLEVVGQLHRHQVGELLRSQPEPLGPVEARRGVGARPQLPLGGLIGTPAMGHVVGNEEV